MDDEIFWVGANKSSGIIDLLIDNPVLKWIKL